MLAAPALTPGGGGAAGEEGVGGDLTHLAAGGGVVGAEVGPVVGRDARLERAAAGIAADDPAAGKAFHPEVEGAGGRHVREGLVGGGFGVACCPGDDLGELAAGDVV